MEYVIIGNSTAGIGCAEGIRGLDKKGNITIISDESYHCYSRPLISYFIQGKIPEDHLYYRNKNFYKEQHIKLLSKTRVMEIKYEEKQLLLSNGEFLSYGKLLLATGSSAFEPPIEGIDGVKNKTSFISLDDAFALKTMLDKKKKVLIIGAGLIGLKCAEGILGQVGSINIVDLAPQVLNSILDSDSAAVIQDHFEQRGVKFFLSAAIKSIKDSRLLLEGSESISFDILVVAAGVRPNTALLQGKAEIGRGIKINERGETSLKDVYAAGDCTETLDVSSGTEKIMALLPNAYMQGECAGVNMAGGDKVFDKAIPMNAIGFMGLHLSTAGTYAGEQLIFKQEGHTRKLFYSDNKLKGYIFMGDVTKSGIFTSLIRDRTPLDTIDFPLICEKPGLMAFTKKVRAEKLGAFHED
ncbi:MAG: FAD-dependent oxidoreductase [Treponema sp.]|nr:FAD-dependent oxidoreductase [Treponema sp.]